jgi:hypothetical protein
VAHPRSPKGGSPDSGEVIDVLARAIHGDYVRRKREQGATGEDAALSWEALPETLRNSNRAQAIDIERKLTAIGCEVAPAAGGEAAMFEFTEPEVEILAKLEHQRWWKERLQEGWVRGPTRNVKRMVSPYLVDWDSLTEDVRNLDRDTVRALPRFLALAGFTIRRVAPA